MKRVGYGEALQDDIYGALCYQKNAINGVECGAGNGADALFGPVVIIKNNR
jgi:hypothetical protein